MNERLRTKRNEQNKQLTKKRVLVRRQKKKTTTTRVDQREDMTKLYSQTPLLHWLFIGHQTLLISLESKAQTGLYIATGQRCLYWRGGLLDPRARIKQQERNENDVNRRGERAFGGGWRMGWRKQQEEAWGENREAVQKNQRDKAL